MNFKIGDRVTVENRPDMLGTVHGFIINWDDDCETRRGYNPDRLIPAPRQALKFEEALRAARAEPGKVYVRKDVFAPDDDIVKGVCWSETFLANVPSSEPFIVTNEDLDAKWFRYDPELDGEL